MLDTAGSRYCTLPAESSSAAARAAIRKIRTRITLYDGGPGSNPIMKAHPIAVIPGDGIGQEVLPPTLKLLEACGERFGLAFNWRHFDWSADYYFRHGRMMPEDALDQLRPHDAILLGAVGHQDLPDNVTLNGLLLP